MMWLVFQFDCLQMFNFNCQFNTTKKYPHLQITPSLSMNLTRARPSSIFISMTSPLKMIMKSIGWRWLLPTWPSLTQARVQWELWIPTGMANKHNPTQPCGNMLCRPVVVAMCCEICGNFASQCCHENLFVSSTFTPPKLQKLFCRRTVLKTWVFTLSS